jgi:hypothetical protein
MAVYMKNMDQIYLFIYCANHYNILYINYLDAK